MKKSIFKRWWFWVIIVVVLIGAIGSGGGNDPEEVATVPTSGEIQGTKESVSTPVPKEISSETLSQKNAVAKADTYSDAIAFSKSGLVEQLEFDGFSNEDATYAVNKISVDWKEQAVKKAKSYLAIMSFSRSGLIEQLEFDGFTNEEATYAVGQVGF